MCGSSTVMEKTVDLVKREPVRKFQVGDVVRSVKTGVGLYEIGKEYTVTGYGRDPYDDDRTEIFVLMSPSSGYLLGKGNYAREDMLELVSGDTHSAPPEVRTPKFKDGDRVRSTGLIGEPSGEHVIKGSPMRNGERPYNYGKVPDDEWIYKSAVSWDLAESDLTLIADTPAHPSGFEVGDRVKLRKNERANFIALAAAKDLTVIAIAPWGSGWTLQLRDKEGVGWGGYLSSTLKKRKPKS
jgi:hypothetical protein